MDFRIAPFPILDRVFLLMGLTGAFVILVRVVLLVAGGSLSGDDFSDPAGDGHGDMEDGFKFLSVHGLASFFMMFGLVGLALSRQSQAGAGLSVLGGILAGLAALWIIARVFRFALGLQSNGTLHPRAAAGCLGTVNETIPAGGTGRVNVRIGQRLREMDAIHAEGEELPTGTPIRVVRVDRSLAVVQPQGRLNA